MNIKKIVAPSMAEAMKKVKIEVGENAVILHSKAVNKGGFLGMFSKKHVEVIAALDDEVIMTERSSNISKQQSQPLSDPIPLSDPLLNKEISLLKKEIAAIKDSVHKDITHYPDLIQTQLSYLISQGISHDHILRIGDKLLQKWRNVSQEPGIGEIENWCINILIEDLESIQFNQISDDVKYINFMGPTGVGKTTTIAKLAAEAVLNKQKKTALITADTYRVAAIEQLKTYAELLNIPIEIVYDQRDFRLATEKFADFDLVLIDTAGRNFLQSNFVADLKKMVVEQENMLNFLVLSMTMKEEDLYKIVENFQGMEINQFIFTKVDETSSRGMMYNLLYKYRLGVAYITAGQDVPDDITHATKEVIIESVLRNDPI